MAALHYPRQNFHLDCKQTLWLTNVQKICVIKNIVFVRKHLYCTKYSLLPIRHNIMVLVAWRVLKQRQKYLKKTGYTLIILVGLLIKKIFSDGNLVIITTTAPLFRLVAREFVRATSPCQASLWCIFCKYFSKT